MAKKEDVNDLTDEFDRRLEAQYKRKVPSDETDAAITVYERLRTARAICQSLLPAGFSEAAVVEIAVEIGRVKQSGQSIKSRA